jgi:hypothetical protein
MGGKYAGPEKVERVKRCIRTDLHPITVVYPGLINKLTGIDANQATGALRKIAPKPNEPVDIGGKSKLIRLYRGFGVVWSEAADLWYYDPVGHEFLPFLPIVHEFIRESCPLIRGLIYSPETVGNSPVGQRYAPIKTY